MVKSSSNVKIKFIIFLLLYVTAITGIYANESKLSFKTIKQFEISKNNIYLSNFFIENDNIFYTKYIRSYKVDGDYRDYKLCRLNINNGQIKEIDFPAIEMKVLVNVVYGKKNIYIAGIKSIYKVNRKLEIVKKAQLPYQLRSRRCYIRYDKVSGKEYISYSKEIAVKDKKSEFGYKKIETLIILDADTFESILISPVYKTVYGIDTIYNGNIYLSYQDDKYIHLIKYNLKGKKSNRILKIKKNSLHEKYYISISKNYILVETYKKKDLSKSLQRFFIYDLHNHKLLYSSKVINFNVCYYYMRDSMLFIVGDEKLLLFDINKKKVVNRIKFQRHHFESIVYSKYHKLFLLSLKGKNPSNTDITILNQAGKYVSKIMNKNSSLVILENEYFYFLVRNKNLIIKEKLVGSFKKTQK